MADIASPSAVMAIANPANRPLIARLQLVLLLILPVYRA
jgi:hypothetical protein